MQNKSKTPWWILLISFALAVVVLVIFYFSSRTSLVKYEPSFEEIPVPPPSEQPVQNPFPFVLTTIDGDTISGKMLLGKVVFLNFFATWCPPCRAEIPSLVKLYNKYRSDGFIVLGISVDQRNPLPKVKEFLAQNKVNYPVALATRQIVEYFGGVSSIPTSFLIDREGRIRTRIIGYRDESEIEQAIRKLLGEKTAEKMQI